MFKSLAYFQQTEPKCCEDWIYDYQVKPMIKYAFKIIKDLRYFNIEVHAEWTNKIKAKSLELIIDGHLSLTKLVDEMSRKISSAVGPKETGLLIRITKL